MEVLRRTIIVVAILLTTVVLVNADEDNCISHDELIEIDPSDLTVSMACDNIGAAYISGVLGLKPNYNSENLLENYSFYVLTRVFLNTHNFSSDFQSKTQSFSPLLIAMLDILGSQEFEGFTEQQIGEDRKKLYIAFVLYQFFSIEGLPKDYSELFQLKIAGVIHPMQITGNQLECFIVADIPTLPILQVFASNSYASCLEV